MAYKSKGPSMRQGGTFMSKHNSSYMHKQNLLNDMPVDDHAGGPLNQKEEEKPKINYYGDRFNEKGQSQADIVNLRKNQVNRATSIYEAGDMTLNDYNAIIDSANQSIDSIGNVNKRIDKVLRGHEFKLKGEK